MKRMRELVKFLEGKKEDARLGLSNLHENRKKEYKTKMIKDLPEYPHLKEILEDLETILQGISLRMLNTGRIGDLYHYSDMAKFKIELDRHDAVDSLLREWINPTSLEEWKDLIQAQKEEAAVLRQT